LTDIVLDFTMAAAVKETVANVLDKIHGRGESVLHDTSPEEYESLRERYATAGQDHVFAFYDGLKSNEKAQLFQQLSSFDPNHINELASKALQPPKVSDEQRADLEPLPEAATASILDSNLEDLQKWHDEGLRLLADNKVAVVLMAGGQGTRLGSSAPKGCFDIGLPSQKSLFQIQAERIAQVQFLAEKRSGKKAVVPWYVMTSGPTRKPTEEFFQERSYFGLEPGNVLFFEQGVLPCISNEGKILLENKSKVSPNYSL
jgi:UDP-N-acetylglucosamine/UDP-N-acetylgalactosamine diphosphorylase